MIFAHLQEPGNQPGSPKYRDIKNMPVLPTASIAEYNLVGQVEISDLEILGKNYSRAGD